MIHSDQMILAPALNITYLPPQNLKPYPSNARTHSKKQLRQIADSIRTFGFTNPILLDQNNTIIAGHGRVEAAKILGMTEVPTVLLQHLSETQKRAYILADNRLAEKAGWDRGILAIELQNLMEMGLDFDITLTGFEMPEIDILIQESEEEQDEDDTIPAEPVIPITRKGDLWQLGDHLIYCGNSLEEESYATLMQGQKAEMIFTDPPYNVPIQGHVSGLGKTRHAEFVMASGEMTSNQFTHFLENVCRHMSTHSVDGSLHFICMDWRHISEMMTAGTRVYTEFKNLCVWNKDRGGMGALYRSKHELVFLFKHGTEPHINNIELGKHGRYRTNVWDYPAVNTMQTGPNRELTEDDWLALHANYRWNEAKGIDESGNEFDTRDINYWVESYLVRQKDLPGIVKCLTKFGAWGKTFPSESNISDVFLAEMPWHKALDVLKSGWQKMPDAPYEMLTTSLTYNYVSDYDASNTLKNIRLPSIWLQKELGLLWSGKNMSFSDQRGQPIASNYKLLHGGAGHNTHLMKKQALQELMKREKLSLLWIVVGEKRVLSSSWDHSRNEGPRRSHFSSFYTLDAKGISKELGKIDLALEKWSQS